MKKVLIIYGVLVLIVVLVVVLRFRGIDLIPKISTSPKVEVKGQEFSLEIADEDKERVKGLSERNSLAENKGMLFVFDKKGKYGFWMRNVKFPLDIIYISDDTIVDIIKNAEPKSEDDTNIPVFEPKTEANYVLEINGGLSDKYKIATGDKVTFSGVK